MSSQRDVREKALHYLFANASHSDNAIADNIFWELSLEPEILNITKLSLKTLKHQLQSLSKWVEVLNELSASLAPVFKSYEYKKEARHLLATAGLASEMERKFSIACNIKGREEIAELYAQSKQLKASLAEFKTILESVSVASPLMDQLPKSINQLLELTSRVEMIDQPLKHLEQKPVEGLVKAHVAKNTLQEDASTLVENVEKSLDQLDVAIMENLDNYKDQQLGKVEFSILRLGAYEIMVAQTPKGIVINEAIRLARKFATENAVPLINGVLDKLEPIESSQG